MDVLVACCLWGKWPATRTAHPVANRGGDVGLQGEYIRRLRNSVARNLTLPHRFVCFTDDEARVPEGIEARKLDVPWFGRALPKAYVYGAPFTGCDIAEGTRILLFDLDSVIVGDLAPFFDHGADLVARERVDPPQPNVPDGDLIFTVAGSRGAHRCAEIYKQEMATHGAATDRGDERLLLEKARAATWATLRPGMVVSYRLHCRKALPKGARVVSFHGNPLPDQASEPWVRGHWR